MSKPLVSLTVICYKAEKFIREAIDGALAQTYSPLEIIFSDDASPDNTFAIIKEAVKDYNGPHKIVLNRNETNMGIGAHVSKVWFEIAKGDWIIVSAGDDVSLPHRVERLMEFAADDVGALHHYSELIDEDSNTIPHTDTYDSILKIFEKNSIEETIKRKIHLRGATMCLNRKLLDYFGKFNNDVINEDVVLAYRAQFFGQIIHIDEKLMRYREHVNSITYNPKPDTFDGYRNIVLKNARSYIALNNQVISDNKLIGLPQRFITEVRASTTGYEMDKFLYGSDKFKIAFLWKPQFYFKLFKRLTIKPYLQIKRLREK